MTRVKICPSCNGLISIAETKCPREKCGFNFTGDEDGMKTNSFKLDTLQVSPSIADLKQYLSLLPSKRRVGDEIKFHSKRILLGLSLLGMGILCYLASWIFKDIRFFAGLFQLVGILGVLLGLGLSVGALLKGTKDILKGPKQKTTADAIKSFYLEGLFEWPQNYGLAWSVLSPNAQSEFGSFGQFKDYWEKTIKTMPDRMDSVLKNTNNIEKSIYSIYQKGWTTNHYFTIENTKTTDSDNYAICVVNYDLSIAQVKSITAGGKLLELLVGQVTIPQTTGLVKLHDNWYLCNGKLALPPNW